MRPSPFADEFRNKALINERIRHPQSENSSPYHPPFEIQLTYGDVGSKTSTTFAVQHTFGGEPQDQQLRNWRRDNAFIPWVAVAAEIPV